MSQQPRNIRTTIWINGEKAEGTLRELTNEAKKLRNQIANAERGSQQYVNSIGRLHVVNKAIHAHRQDIKGLEPAWQRAANHINRFIGLYTVLAAAMAGVVLSIKQFAQSAGELADAQADVQKTTGLSNTEMAKLNGLLKTIDTRTSRKELLKLAEEAGRLGKSGVNDVFGFVQAADKLKVALGDDLGGEEAIRDVGKMVEVYRVAEKTGSDFEEAMMRLGSAINHVSASGSNQASFLVSYLKRLGGISAQTTLTAEQTIGFAAALDESGQSVEVSGTAMAQVITNMFKETDDYAKIAGRTVKQFRYLLATDTNYALELFFHGLQGNNEGLETMAQKFQGLGIDGARATQVLATLANQFDLVRQRQNQAAYALEKNTSLLDEFEKKNNNLAGTMDKLGKALYGHIMRPEFIGALTAIVDKLYEWVRVPLSQSIDEERIKFLSLAADLNTLYEATDQRRQIIEELQGMYPDYLGHINAETASHQELSLAIEQVNQHLVQKAYLQRLEEERADVLKSITDLELERSEEIQKAFEYVIQLADKGHVSTDKTQSKLHQIKDALQQLQQIDGPLPGSMNHMEAALTSRINRIEHLKALQHPLNLQLEYFGNLISEETHLLEENNNAQLRRYNILQQNLEQLAARIDKPDQSWNLLLLEYIELYGEDFSQFQQFSMRKLKEHQVINAEQAEIDKNYYDKRKEALLRISEFLAKEQEDEVKMVQLKYQKMLELAKEYGISQVELAQQLEWELEQIALQGAQKAGDQFDRNQESLMEQALEESYDNAKRFLLESADFEQLTMEEKETALTNLKLEHLRIRLDAYRQFGKDVLPVLEEIHSTEKEAEDRSQQLTINALNKIIQQYNRYYDFRLQTSNDLARIVQTGAMAFRNAMLQEIKAIIARSIATQLAKTITLTGPFAPVAVAGVTALVTGMFDAALPRFDRGGFTGKNGIPDPARPGRYITGYSHDNEYIIPSHELKAPDVQQVIQRIENTQSPNIQVQAPSVHVSPSEVRIDLSTVESLLSIIASNSEKEAVAILSNKAIRDIKERMDKDLIIQNKSRI